ncbi:hypothetical protein Desti_0540 [Desulfomonile tiedjei DSM 6799]|uniref:Uncharacterized protein n=1 Tax=Desulfomonile tiedjei (strain ATCC 49306 / DSM 6799 / DCB-1) TaxID=706587 RepID=I4C132_DESTA|nr:hypothetical protein Desti_0540 [Desulfomonile tiedjei DSM 6799]
MVTLPLPQKRSSQKRREKTGLLTHAGIFFVCSDILHIVSDRQISAHAVVA